MHDSNSDSDTSDSRPRVDLYDTTLRDGTQREGLSLTVEDKLRIARRLDSFGVRYIEGGWPGSNPKDVEFFRRQSELELKNAEITAFGATCRSGSDASADRNLAAIMESGVKVATLFGKSSTLHVQEVLRTTLDENLRLIRDSVAFLVGEGRRVIYDAEHFFDGHRLDSSYALQTLEAAAEGGAMALVLCDTNGGSMPWQVHALVQELTARFSVPLGIHAHDDGGCAVANSLEAVRAGATQVQGTINGYGERCGNANLVTIAPNLELKMGRHAVGAPALRKLSELSRGVAELANLQPDEHAAYVGRSAFAHKGGVHVAAMRHNADSYQHVDPLLVGNEMRVVVSELSGRGNLRSKAEEFGAELGDGADVALLDDIKRLESEGYAFEAAEASVALLMTRRAPNYRPFFEVLDYHVLAGAREGTANFSDATVRMRVGRDIHHTASTGDGPVSALDGALRKAIATVYPEIGDTHLMDYKVRILDGRDGTSATTRVLIDYRDAQRRWSTVGASQNIIDASWEALVDGIEYGLMVKGIEPRH